MTKISNFTVSGTGLKVVTGIPFEPTHIDFYVAQKNGVTENFAHISIGAANVQGSEVKQMAHSLGDKTQSFFDRCVHHRSLVGGVWQDVIIANAPTDPADFIESSGGGLYQFTINVTHLSGSQKIYYIARS